jgi:hypothetical protein
MARKASKSLTAAVSAEIKSNFDLGNFKNKKGLTGSVKFKAQQWIPLSPAFQSVTSVPGIPTGHICLLRGHSDTGKTTALIEAAIACQKVRCFTCIHCYRDEVELGTRNPNGSST